MADAPRLVPLSFALREAICDMARECHLAGNDRYLGAEQDYATWLARCEEVARGENLKPGWVPTQFFCLTLAGRALGGSRLRLELNESLLREGGNIGYDVRPSEQGRGYGTLILALTLEEAARRGLSRACVTTNEDNVRSRKVIERNGGRLAGRNVSDESGKLVRQYWIDIPSDGGAGQAP